MPTKLRKKNKMENDFCKCEHERKLHGKSHSIDYTQGKCSECQCEGFMIDNNKINEERSL